MEINDQVVIDSTSAPNYGAWQNNVYGDGAEVKHIRNYLFPNIGLTLDVVRCSALWFLQHIQVKYNLYYFEVQNMAEALQGERPKLMQVGPYAYDEYYVKFDITWSDDGDTVTYGTQKYYLFNQEETGAGLSPDDYLTLPYSTVSGFVYLLGTIDESDQKKIDHELHVSVCSIFRSICGQVSKPLIRFSNCIYFFSDLLLSLCFLRY